MFTGSTQTHTQHTQDPGTVTVSWVVPFFKVTESLPLGGSSQLLPLTPPPNPPTHKNQDPGTFTVSFVTVVPFFKVTESLPLGGSAQLARRDLRPGRQSAAARRTQEGVRVEMSWGEPLAGGCLSTIFPCVHVQLACAVAQRTARRTQEGVRVEMSWGEPLAGER